MRRWFGSLVFILFMSGCLDTIPTDTPGQPAPLEPGPWSYEGAGRNYSFDGVRLSLSGPGDHFALRLRVTEKIALPPFELAISGERDEAEGDATGFVFAWIPLQDGHPHLFASYQPHEFGAVHAKAGLVELHQSVRDPQPSVFASSGDGRGYRFPEGVATLTPGDWLLLVGLSTLASAELTIDPFPSGFFVGLPTSGTGCKIVVPSEMDSDAAVSSSIGALGPLNAQAVESAHHSFEVVNHLLFSHFAAITAGEAEITVRSQNETWSSGSEASANWELFGDSFRRETAGTYEIAHNARGLGTPIFYQYCDHTTPGVDAETLRGHIEA